MSRPGELWRVEAERVLPARLRARIHFTDDCWQWLGGDNGRGYGKAYWNGRMVYAHRLVYELLVGPIPDGLHIDHYRCDNPGCCNPSHMRPVTQRENNLRSDGMAARWAARSVCALGHPFDGVSRGWRYCRTCNRDKERRRRERSR